MRRRYIVLTKECVRKKKKSTIGTIYSSEHFWRLLVLQERRSTKQYCSVASAHVIQYGTRRCDRPNFLFASSTLHGTIVITSLGLTYLIALIYFTHFIHYRPRN